MITRSVWKGLLCLAMFAAAAAAQDCFHVLGSASYRDGIVAGQAVAGSTVSVEVQVRLADCMERCVWPVVSRIITPDGLEHWSDNDAPLCPGETRSFWVTFVVPDRAGETFVLPIDIWSGGSYTQPWLPITAVIGSPDVTGDGVLTDADVSAVQKALGQKRIGHPADVSGNNSVGLEDLQAVKNWRDADAS